MDDVFVSPYCPVNVYPSFEQIGYGENNSYYEKAENIEFFVHLNKVLFSVECTVVMIWWAVCLKL